MSLRRKMNLASVALRNRFHIRRAVYKPVRSLLADRLPNLTRPRGRQRPEVRALSMDVDMAC